MDTHCWREVQLFAGRVSIILSPWLQGIASTSFAFPAVLRSRETPLRSPGMHVLAPPDGQLVKNIEELYSGLGADLAGVIFRLDSK